MKKKIILTILALLGLFLAIGLDVRLKNVHYTIEDKRLGKPIKLALVTDLHSCNYGKDSYKIIDKLKKENPDIILLGGDIIDDEMPEDNARRFIEIVSSLYATYYVTGNHEYWTGDIDRIRKDVEELGAIVLSGETVRLDIRGQIIDLTGIEDKDLKNPDWINTLESLANEKDSTYYQVLLTHRPEEFELYSELGYDLVLAGHAHGGQWRIPFILNGTFAPNQGFFPKYAGGRYEKSNTTMIVSRGLARESTRVPRFYNRPELVIVELVGE